MLRHKILELDKTQIAAAADRFKEIVDEEGIEAGMAHLRSQKGYHMGHVAKICMKTFGIGLRDAKRMIYGSPSWQREVESVQPLIDIFEEVSEEQQASQKA